MLFAYKSSKISDETTSLNVQNVESMKFDRLGSFGSVTMTSGARHTLNEHDFEMLRNVVMRIPTAT